MYKRIMRRDGSVVILVPRRESQSVTWDIAFKVGSRHETNAVNGISHFIEHLMFKGTKKRPNTKIISRELDSVGAEYNAFTSKDNTGYYIETDAAHLELGIDMLSDMLQHSLFDKREMDRERGVIVEELNIYRDNPAMRIDEVFERCIFGATPLGMEIGGPREVIKTIPHAKLVAFQKKHYHPGNMVIGVAGHFDEARVLALINKYFPVRSRSPRTRTAPMKIAVNRPRVTLEYKDTEQARLMIGFPGYGRLHPKTDAASLFSVIMGGTMSSRLFITIRERKGLVYDIRATNEAYEDVGYFAVTAGFDKGKVFEGVSAIKQELVKVAAKGVTAEELKRAKDNIHGRLILRFERPSVYLSFLMSQELLSKRIETLEQKLSRLSKVTRPEVNAVAHALVRWEKANLALIGPYKESKAFLKAIS